ncbi:BCCT family transporter, partial [Escherichia coli]|nr:BCCT family transporter [Escherichia coli]
RGGWGGGGNPGRVFFPRGAGPGDILTHGALVPDFFTYPHRLPLTVRSALYPIIGDRIYGPIGHAVDIFAVIGTVFGVATSLGYGVFQVNSGLNHFFGGPSIETEHAFCLGASRGLARFWGGPLLPGGKPPLS